MVRGWFTIRVELLSGGGLTLRRPPGRELLVGPQHTLADVARATDLAFARWDLSHLHEFTFPDGRRYGIPDDEYGQEILDCARVQAGRVVSKGSTFQYVFDLGDNWQHRCRVVATNVDPLELAGIVPEQPIPIWGWGWIPDQYGRRTEDDSGDGDADEQP